MTTVISAHTERVRANARKHWLGQDVPAAQSEISREIRAQYCTTAHEYFKAATALYESMTVRDVPAATAKKPLSLANRNVQLFLAYSLLWESFQQIYQAANYTHFALQGADREPLETDAVKVGRVLAPPYVEEAHFASSNLLRNGETLDGALSRMLGRSSRELQEFYQRDVEQTLTNMDAFLQGEVMVGAGGQECDAWLVQALDDDGQPLEVGTKYSLAKYRGVIRCHCWQIRHNLNYVGKSEGSIDDAILVMRAFCLVEPLVNELLKDDRKGLVFSL